MTDLFAVREGMVSLPGKDWPCTPVCTIVTLADLASDVVWHSTVNDETHRRPVASEPEPLQLRRDDAQIETDPL